MLLFLFACASEEPQPITLEWYTETVPCVDEVATWVLPEPAPVSVSWTYEANGIRAFGSTLSTDDGAIDMPCINDVTFTYALAPE